MWRDDYMYISIAENEEQKSFKVQLFIKNDFFFFFSLGYKLVSNFLDVQMFYCIEYYFLLK